LPRSSQRNGESLIRATRWRRVSARSEAFCERRYFSARRDICAREFMQVCVLDFVRPPASATDRHSATSVRRYLPDAVHASRTADTPFTRRLIVVARAIYFLSHHIRAPFSAKTYALMLFLIQVSACFLRRVCRGASLCRSLNATQRRLRFVDGVCSASAAFFFLMIVEILFRVSKG